MENINGFYDDDGNKINIDVIAKPGLCLICKKEETNDRVEHVLCVMIRYDQRDSKEFECGAYEKK